MMWANDALFNFSPCQDWSKEIEYFHGFDLQYTFFLKRDKKKTITDREECKGMWIVSDKDELTYSKFEAYCSNH